MLCTLSNSRRTWFPGDINAISIDRQLRQVPIVPRNFPFETFRAIHSSLEYFFGVVFQPIMTGIDILFNPGFFIATFCRWYLGKSFPQKVENTSTMDKRIVNDQCG